jgi:hypothetical protein
MRCTIRETPDSPSSLGVLGSSSWMVSLPTVTASLYATVTSRVSAADAKKGEELAFINWRGLPRNIHSGPSVNMPQPRGPCRQLTGTRLGGLLSGRLLARVDMDLPISPGAVLHR